MKSANNKVVLFALLLLHCVSAFSSNGGNKKRSNGNWISMGTAVGFYSVNTKHAGRAAQKLNFQFAFYREWGVDKTSQAYFSTGLAYFYHGLGFRSYFFKPDSVALYNKKFNYDYTVFVHELQAPFEYKYLFTRRDNSLYGPYVKAGICLRWLAASEVYVRQNGAKVKYDYPGLEFRTPLIDRQLSSIGEVGLGFQKNGVGPDKSSAFVEINFKYGFGQYFFDRPYAPSSLFLSNSHIFLLIGFKI